MITTVPVPGSPPKTAMSVALVALFQGVRLGGGLLLGIGRSSHSFEVVFHAPGPPVWPLLYVPSGSQMCGRTPSVTLRVVGVIWVKLNVTVPLVTVSKAT